MYVPDVWFTSDTHHGHKNIIKFEPIRKWDNTDDMDEALIQRWNSKVKPHDIIFHIGDVFLCGAKRAEYIASRLNGRKILILGNHDSFSKKKYRDMGFDVHNYYFYEDFLLSHYPQDGRLLLQAQQHGLRGNICGHVHSNIEGLNPDVHFCACVENHDFYPVHIDTIKQSFKGE
ncbi:metallophosphatase_gp272 [Bacillus phage vB_BceM_WH1]|nr:metallophosphatase_gp272 [Bacillus phage vB_BceM_WH1]